MTTTTQKADSSTTDQGPGTRRRLLDTAAELFATRGSRDVSVRDICERACANVAAVNYHFGGKDRLHEAALAHARERALREAPFPAGPAVAGPTPPEERLRRHLRSMFGRAFAAGPAGWYMQMVLREMVDPTPALKATIEENIGPHQRRLEAIVGQLMRLDPDRVEVKDVAATLIASAIYYHSCRPAIEHMRPGFAFDQATAERLTETVTRMVLGGVGAFNADASCA